MSPTEDNPTPRKRGRPTKKVDHVIAELLRLLRRGWSRSQAAIDTGIAPRTVQRWMRDDANFRQRIADAEWEGRDLAKYRAWVRHPFRGRRPPREGRARAKAHPRPRFEIPRHYRRIPASGRRLGN